MAGSVGVGLEAAEVRPGGRRRARSRRRPAAADSEPAAGAAATEAAPAAEAAAATRPTARRRRCRRSRSPPASRRCSGSASSTSVRAPPPPQPPPGPLPIAPPYQIGNHAFVAAPEPARTSSKRALEDALDGRLEPQGDAPDEGLVGRLEPGQLRLRRRPGRIERAWAIVLSSVRRYAASIARIIAPAIVRAGICRPTIQVRTPAAARATPRSTKPWLGRLTPMMNSGDAGNGLDRRAAIPALGDLRRRAARTSPCVTAWASRSMSNFAVSVATSVRCVGVEIARLVEARQPGRAVRRSTFRPG